MSYRVAGKRVDISDIVYGTPTNLNVSLQNYPYILQLLDIYNMCALISSDLLFRYD